ncbi:MAG: YbbR-like domain-containing protein, partial [Lentisphaerae bacterium]|nr:YbbR-like domain-containing protein [Lentisphaerota bacterium]
MATRWRQLSEPLLNNWKLKVLAFVLALMSFFAIQNEISFEAPYSIPIVVLVDQPGIAILDQNPMTADVTFRGSEEDLRRLDQRQIKAMVRLKVTYPSGSESVRIGPQNIEGISGVRVVNVQPSTVTLTFDHEEEKKVAVTRPTIIGTPFVGKVEIDCEPQTVTIRGPKLRLAEVNSVSTEPVDVEGRVESFSKQLRVLSPSDTWISHIKPE